MGKINSSEAFEILVKDHKENILKKFGTRGLDNVRIYFVDNVADTVYVNDKSIKTAFKIAAAHAAP